ncbi:enhanced serine sensitivity protein SseB [Erysipelothrix sp. HDW6C]|uniref:enhanced serine sensitivity protein SseB n=1 Tax=Erysipelothrix sp. HDW6C TaxID=2714930 RepID=UPI001407DA50|nr:enhanced serine sensitivity protein SseB [Erysipelothrix sp. HDW6C]QIK70358.1 enhanced serine sensitivity protein SseB [Erysipelothrix sp. HDW6C]
MVDVNTPVTNPNLKENLKAYRESNSESLLDSIFEAIIMEAHLLAVVSFDNAPKIAEGKLTEGAVMRVNHLTNAEGQSYLPLFTDWEEVARWQSLPNKPETLIVRFDDFAAMVQKNETITGVVINPFSTNFVLSRQSLDNFKRQKEIRLTGTSQEVIEKETEIMLGEPSDYPQAMVAAIANALKHHLGVKKAWLQLMRRNGESSYLIVVDSEDRSVVPVIGESAKPFLKGMFVDIMLYEANSSIGQRMDSLEPFYLAKSNTFFGKFFKK